VAIKRTMRPLSVKKSESMVSGGKPLKRLSIAAGVPTCLKAGVKENAIATGFIGTTNEAVKTANDVQRCVAPA